MPTESFCWLMRFSKNVGSCVAAMLPNASPMSPLLGEAAKSVDSVRTAMNELFGTVSEPIETVSCASVPETWPSPCSRSQQHV